MSINRMDAREVTAELIAAITPLLEVHGLKMGSHRSNYGDHYAFKFEAHGVELGEDGFDYGTAEAQNWLLYGKRNYEGDGPFENPKDVLGKIVTINRTEYQFLGFVTRSPKYPLRFKRLDDGKIYKFPNSATKHLR